MELDVFTISKHVSVNVAGGSAMILNPYTMVVLDNDSQSDSKQDFEVGTQFMLVGAFETTDTWLLVVSDNGDFYDDAGVFGIVLRRASFDKLLEVAVTGTAGDDFSNWSEDISTSPASEDPAGEFDPASVPSPPDRPKVGSVVSIPPVRKPRDL